MAVKSTEKGITAWIKKEKAARTPYPFVFDSRPHDLEKSPGKFPSQPSQEKSASTPDAFVFDFRLTTDTSRRATFTGRSAH